MNLNNEDEVIKAVREEYDKKLLEKDEEINKIKDEQKQAIENLKKAHIEQIRALVAGRDTTFKNKNEFEETPTDEFTETVKEAKNLLKKY